MHRVTKTYGHELGLSATFRQPQATSHCRFIHGYALGFKIVFECETLDGNGWVKDFGSLKALKQRLCDTFDHKMLLAQDDPYLAHLQEALYFNGQPLLGDIVVVPKVGCESFAWLVYGWALETLTEEEVARGVRVAEVECREHAGNAASYMGN
jgi:6-pyruvoyltetrahydropterin/6-carboxytetrahydropterin synthase